MTNLIIRTMGKYDKCEPPSLLSEIIMPVLLGVFFFIALCLTQQDVRDYEAKRNLRANGTVIEKVTRKTLVKELSIMEASDMASYGRIQDVTDARVLDIVDIIKAA